MSSCPSTTKPLPEPIHLNPILFLPERVDWCCNDAVIQLYLFSSTHSYIYTQWPLCYQAVWYSRHCHIIAVNLKGADAIFAVFSDEFMSMRPRFSFTCHQANSDLGRASVVVNLWRETLHEDEIPWETFPHYWPFVWGISYQGSVSI